MQGIGNGFAQHSTQNSQKGSKTHKTEFDFGKLITEHSSVKMIRQSEKENWLVYFSSIHKISSNSISIWLHVENKHQQLQASPPFSFLIRWNHTLKIDSASQMTELAWRTSTRSPEKKRRHFASMHQCCPFSGADKDTLWKNNTNVHLLRKTLLSLYQQTSQCC